MPVDLYSYCPGGTGKKLKFCDCCKDIVKDLEKVEKMIEGEQPMACLEYLERLDQKHPGRASVLAMKSMIQFQLGKTEDAKQTVARFLEKYPDNPVALSESAMIKIAEDDTLSGLRSAVETLHQAVEKCDVQVPTRVYETIGVLAHALLVQGHILAARGHLLMQAAMAGDKDPRALSLLFRINGSSQVPLLLKDDRPWELCPDINYCDAAFKSDFDAALELARHNRWLASERRFTQLAETEKSAGPDSPAVWHNLSILRAWLADNQGAVAALKKLSALDIPLEDAAEALALAALLDPGSLSETFDLVNLDYSIKDIEVLLARLSVSRQTVTSPVPPPDSDEPPPKAIFWILDREVPKTGVGISRQAVPTITGEVLVFGKQTDRQARLEYLVYRDERFDTAKGVLADLAGDAIVLDCDPDGKENIVGDIPVLQQILQVPLRLPADTPVEHSKQLISEHRRDAVFSTWTQLKMALLDDKSPLDVVGDDSQQAKLAAAVLLLEMNLGEQDDVDLDELRGQLSLPSAEPIDPTGLDVESLSLVRLPRLMVEKLSDEDLTRCYRRAAVMRAVPAVRKLAAEVVGRPSLDEKVDKAEAYELLIQYAQSSDESLVYIHQAREAAEKAEEKSGTWDVAELALRLQRAESDEAERLLLHIRSEHFNEPGVSDALYNVMAQFGAVGPAMPGIAPESIEPDMPLGPEIPAQAASDEGKLWTPESASQTSEGQQGGKLWTPGMD